LTWNDPQTATQAALLFAVRGGVSFCLGHPHIEAMANWQASKTRQPPKTKTELREMLTEAVRNTQPGAEHRPKNSPKTKKNQP
jgi:hypothetical protein